MRVGAKLCRALVLHYRPRFEEDTGLFKIMLDTRPPTSIKEKEKCDTQLICRKYLWKIGRQNILPTSGISFLQR